MCADNKDKQTNNKVAHVEAWMQGAVQSCVAVESSMQYVRVHGEASEMYQRHIGDTSEKCRI